MEAVPPSGITVSGRMASGHRPFDIDMLLPGLAGGRDFPAEQLSVRIIFDRRLDRIALCAA